MTEELMERLYMQQEIDGVLSNINSDKEESVIVVPKVIWFLCYLCILSVVIVNFMFVLMYYKH